ncbi:FAD-dependent thymidylate synthase [Candidatus Odyssella thessalonicensis]|uniref:FAD-dependent thymidylate synthase n=1 Tax=Candidatus Odyssella thessalonicensis TaxID=84647 RepID=UPI000225C1D5|nr:FAD-dependent thymidylate synthase [Candidatus Odyssella thessalonicensis]
MALNALQEQEILHQQQETYQTRRMTVPALEEILYEAIPVLDHGFIRVIDYMGDDSAIVQAARVSYGKGTKKISEDQGLINYLMRHRHSTPFEMCEIKFHIKLPIFVARQWIRHRTANVNEYSARYSIMDKEFYLPLPEHLAAQSKVNNQGRGDVLDGMRAQRVMQLLKEDAVRAYDHYQYMLNETETGEKIDEDQDGLARELARMNLPVNFYTQWYWKIDLHNLMHFLSLRADSHAQYEIRVYAEAMLDVLKKWVPATYQAFVDYRVGAANLSAKGLAVVRTLLAGQSMTREQAGMSLREWRELESVLQIKLP